MEILKKFDNVGCSVGMQLFPLQMLIVSIQTNTSTVWTAYWLRSSQGDPILHFCEHFSIVFNSISASLISSRFCSISDLRQQLALFKQHLHEEEVLSVSVQKSSSLRRSQELALGLGAKA